MFTFTENRSLKMELKNGFTVFIEADEFQRKNEVGDIFDKIRNLFVQDAPFVCHEVLVAVTDPSGKVVELTNMERDLYRRSFYRMRAEKLIALLATLSDRPPER